MNRQLEVDVTNPLYAGQAGAASSITSKPSGATLRSRIRGNHIRGNTRASTFRRTFAALLWDDLLLSCKRPRTLDSESNRRLTEWIVEHMRVATCPIADRVGLGVIEIEVLHLLNPPLNLKHVPRTPARARLGELRRRHLGEATA